MTSCHRTLLKSEDRWERTTTIHSTLLWSGRQGVRVYDTSGKRYMDCLSCVLSAESGAWASSHPGGDDGAGAAGHAYVAAFRNDQLPLFCQELAELCRMDMVLPMNTGAEAVETAIKAARRWGYTVKGIPDGQAEIIVCANNFHGRTTTIVGFSSEPSYQAGFGPFTPGFKIIPFGDAAALEAAITPNTCAFLFEPIQCEAGILLPPAGFLKQARGDL